MSKRWFQEHQRDTWRRQARSKGYRARSAFKLKQIQEKFTLIREGDLVLDVGCHPGGWTQVAVEETGAKGLVIGIDLRSCVPVDGAQLVTGDVTDTSSQEAILELLQEGRKVDDSFLPEVGDGETRLFNTIVSDISPSLTGQYDRDQAISLEFVALVFDFNLQLLATGGSLSFAVSESNSLALNGFDCFQAKSLQGFSPLKIFLPLIKNTKYFL